VQARIHGAAARPQERRVQKIGILPLFGTIFPRANMLTEMSGATSADKFGASFAKLLDDPSIDAIILDVDSPGGQVGGIQEVADMILNARGRKPIVAVANYLMASAAYWIGSAADELIVSPSADVGSIGVFAVHQDVSKALEEDGVKITIISEGKYNTTGNPYEPLSEEARAVIQESVRETYDAFVSAVARNRGAEVEAVKSGFGEGRVVGARQAVEMGMADRIETLDDTINRLLGNVSNPAGMSADSSDLSMQAESQAAEAGQEPVSVQRPTDEARARLALVGQKEIQGDSTMLRNLLKERSAKVARAEELVTTADTEERDLTETEREEFAQLLGEGEVVGQVGELDQKIEKITDERERLRTAAEKKFGVTDDTKNAEKPDDSGVLKMKRAEFDRLSPEAQAAFVKSSGKLEG